MSDINNRSIVVNSKARSLDLSLSPLLYRRVYLVNQSLPYLFHLNVSSCQIKEIRPSFLESMVNLRVLDISHNMLQVIPTNFLITQIKLVTLKLDGNSEMLAIEQGAFSGPLLLQELSVSNADIEVIEIYAFDGVSIDELLMSNSVINKIDSNAFGNLNAKLVYLNSTRIVEFDNDMFSGLENVQTIVTSAYKYCCVRPANLPEENCFPRSDEFSSCADLMSSESLRSLIWIIGLVALLGNGAVLGYRVTVDRARLKHNYGIFVTNLASSDTLMGLYLITIAAVDSYYRDVYIYNDEAWRSGMLCQTAGVLAAISSEAGVLFIILITFDRILVIRFPFGEVKMSTKHAHIASACIWLLAILIAIFPLTYPSYFKGMFYSKTAVCLALPLTRDKPPGWIYSISIFMGFNFITFALITIGQWLIYWEINEQKKKMAMVKTDRANDLRISRNLLMVVAIDFLCWFPVGVIGNTTTRILARYNDTSFKFNVFNRGI